MGKSNWTAADWREKRKILRDARIGYNKNDYGTVKQVYDDDDPLMAQRFVDAGRELAAMMELPALDWPASKWAKEKAV
jgi:hypothetical protein